MKQIALLLSLSLLVLPGCWKDKCKEAPTAQPATPEEPMMDQPGINHEEKQGDTNLGEYIKACGSDSAGIDTEIEKNSMECGEK